MSAFKPPICASATLKTRQNGPAQFTQRIGAVFIVVHVAASSAAASRTTKQTVLMLKHLFSTSASVNLWSRNL